MATVHELFNVRSLMAPAVSLFEDLEPWPMVEMFQTGVAGTQDGTEAVWDREDMDRALAPVTDRDAKAIRIFAKNRDHFRVPMASIRLERFFPARKIFIDQRGLGELKPNAAQQLRRGMRQLENAMRRTAEFMCSELLFNPTGLTVSPSTIVGSEVTFTLDFSIPTSTANTSWGTASTNIASAAELLGMKDATINVSGMNPSTMIMNNSGVDMFLLNDQINAWINRTEPGRRFLNEAGPGGVQGAQKVSGITQFGGIAGIKDWWQFDHGYVPKGGAFTKFLSTDNFVMGPGGGPTLGFTEGFSIVPTTAIGADGLDLVEVKEGPATYAVLETDPVGIRLYRVWDFIPVVLVPEAWRRIDPTP